MDPLYEKEIIPTLYSKIGVLTVRAEMLARDNQDLLAEVKRLQAELEATRAIEGGPGPQMENPGPTGQT